MSRYEYKQGLINAEKLDSYLEETETDKPVIIYGAGNNGRLVAQHLLRKGASVKCFVDVNKSLHQDRPFFIDIVPPQVMKADYNNELIIITPYADGAVVEEILSFTGFPCEKIYRLEFDIVSIPLILPDDRRNVSLELNYAKTACVHPEITVFSLIYNTPEPYLRRSIESVLAQSFRDFEYFIVDHGSNDQSTGRIINEYAALDRRIKVYRVDFNVEVEREKRRESAHLREVLFQEIEKRVDTEFMCWLDSDDFLEEDFLACTYAAAMNHNADMVCVQSWAYGEDNPEAIRYPWYPIISKEIITRSEKEKWLAFCETKMPEAGWGTLVRSPIYLDSFHKTWSYPGGLTTDKLSSYEMLKASNTVVFMNSIYHALTLRRTSIVGGSKSRDWEYMLMWFRWMIDEWLPEVRAKYLSLGLKEDIYAYPLGQFMVEFVFSMTENLLQYKESGELTGFCREVSKLLSEDYISRIIDSQSRYQEQSKRLRSYFMDKETT